MSVEKATGLSWFDVVLHAFVTICITMALAESSGGDEDIIIPLGFATSAVIFGVRRYFALRRRAIREPTTGEVEAMRVEDLEARLADLELGSVRMAELEERLDFAERLLAQHRADSAGRVLARPESG